MSIVEKSDDEIISIADPIWQNLVKSSNIKDYGGFTRDLSSQMLYGANEVELGKQWSSNKLLSSLSEGCKALHPSDSDESSLLLDHCFPSSTSFAPYNICEDKSLVNPP